jgi:signal recognition particle subunit SRP54
VQTGALDRMEVLISSMTKEERLHPEILNASRRQRIAAGAGTTVTEVNAMIKKYNETKKMLKRAVGQMGDGAMGRRKGSGKRKGQKRRSLSIPGMGSGPGGMSMSDMKKLNDMLSNLDE